MNSEETRTDYELQDIDGKQIFFSEKDGCASSHTSDLDFAHKQMKQGRVHFPGAKLYKRTITTTFEEIQ